MDSQVQANTHKDTYTRTRVYARLEFQKCLLPRAISVYTVTQKNIR